MSDLPAALPPEPSRPPPATERMLAAEFARHRRRASAARVRLTRAGLQDYLRERLAAMMPPAPPNPVSGARPGHE